MLGHDFTDMPGRSMEAGDNPHESAMLLRCRWCMRTPAKARQDGCPIRELGENGRIVLSEFNPGGVEHFKGRLCVTCENDIMAHWLMRGSDAYWCGPYQRSEGITGCVFDVEGVRVPEEGHDTV